MLCLVALMIVNVARPSIGADLGFTDSGLTWVVNAYLLIFGGFLLLGGRLGDLYGARRVLVGGLVVFALASLGCGLATSRGALIGARALQGLGGAVVDSVSLALALALIVRLFTAPRQRARAMGAYSFVCSAGGSIGVLLGGVLVSLAGWHWIFLVNVPIGGVVIGLLLRLLPADRDDGAPRPTLDWGGAISIAAALLCAVYAVIDGRNAGWLSAQTLGLAAAAALLLLGFVATERRAAVPLMPLALFTRRSVVVANLAGALWSVGMFAWYFIAALYLQGVLGFSALQPVPLQTRQACSAGLGRRTRRLQPGSKASTKA